MARQQRELLVEPVGVQLLDLLGHAAVQLAAAGVQDRLVGDIAGQRMAEQVGQLALDLLGQDQIGLGQLLRAGRAAHRGAATTPESTG